MRVGSLFTGIGGLDLGLERAGMEIVWQSEIDPHCCRVLSKHWPDAPNLGDVAQIDWSTVERPDLICGGYPCQPFSIAGRRQGERDPRHLWPHFARALRVLRPRWALLENVPGHLSLGFGAVLADLAALGYDCEWESLPAAAFGAPHLRWRLFVVAHSHGGLLSIGSKPDGQPVEPGQPTSRWGHADGRREDVADAEGVPIGPGLRPHEPGGLRRGRPSDRRGPRDVPDADNAGLGERRRPGTAQQEQPAAQRSRESLDHPVRRRHGTPDREVLAGRDRPVHAGWWAAEPDVGRVAYGIPSRVDRLRSLGNAVVPQVAEWIGRQIMEADA